MLDRFYKQDVTYWGVGGRDKFSKTTFNTPVSFKGRWEDKTQEVMNPQGIVVQSQAEVHYPDTVGVVLGGYMYQGTSAASDPRQLTGAREVQALTSKPDLRMLETVKVALL